jgi:hypothetical protein
MVARTLVARLGRLSSRWNVELLLSSHQLDLRTFLRDRWCGDRVCDALANLETRSTHIRSSGSHLLPLDRHQPAVSPPTKRFNVARTGRIITECLPQFLEGRADAVLKLDNGIVGPEFFLNLFLGYDLSGILEQQHENLERLVLQPDPAILLAQLPSPEIELKGLKSRRMPVLRRLTHADLSFDLHYITFRNRRTFAASARRYRPLLSASYQFNRSS